MRPVAVIERAFMTLLEDAIVFAQVAENLVAEQRLEPSRFPRASIVASALALECAANCCVQALPRSKQLRDDIDRLPLLSKFEVYLALRRPGTRLDRGARQVQSAQELKAIRDHLVHPRSRRVPLRETGVGEYEAVGDRFPVLGISKLPASWRGREAISVLRAAAEFYRYFFVESCQLSVADVASVLLADIEVDTPEPFQIRRYHRQSPPFREANEDWRVDFIFLLGTPERKATRRMG